MERHAVNITDLEAALNSARSEAAVILDQVNLVQQELKATTFVGEQAEHLADEMNAKMTTFVGATYDNVDELLRVIVNNMNVVVTKLGGAPWANEPVQRGQAVTAEAARISANQDYEINIEEMTTFAGLVDEWFEAIAKSYLNIQGTIADGTNGWQGPEKRATVTAVTGAITDILGSPGDTEGTGVRAVGASLSGWVRDQVSVMTG